MSAAPTAIAERVLLLKPHALLVDPEAIPQELKDVEQWVTWRYEPNDKHDKWTKVPKNPKEILQGRDRSASTTNPETWGTFDQAWEAYQAHPPVAGDVPMPTDKKDAGNSGLDGIGIVLGVKNPYCGVDLDNCLEDGQFTSEDAHEALELLSGTYTEISPSGRGIRIFCLATKPGKECKTGTREMYDQAGGRFLTVTGHTYGEPAGIADKQQAIDTLYPQWFTKGAKAKTTLNTSIGDTTGGAEQHIPVDDEILIKRMFASQHGAAIRRLWDGDTSAYARDGNAGTSEADLALTAYLARWTDFDPKHIDSLFRQSALYRSKWDEQRGGKTCGQMTIAKVLEGKGPGDGFNGEGSSGATTQSDEGLTWGELQELPPIRPPAPNMPSELIPSFLRGWLTDSAERMSARLELLLIPAFVALGALFGRKVAVRPKAKDTSWLEPLNHVVCYLKSTPECSRLKAAILRLTRVFRDAKVLT
jgi:primase-polymerase (primpol)-like protein